MYHIKKIGFLFLFCLVLAIPGKTEEPHPSPASIRMEKIKWSAELCLPVQSGKPNAGVAGAFSGFIGNELILAGGANFPDEVPWRNGQKTWWNILYSIYPEDPHPEWSVQSDVLPGALAYGISIELPEGLLCIGGCDSVKCSSEVFLLQKKGKHIEKTEDWPSLPVPLANATGTLLDNHIYVAGGQENMSHPEATGHFYLLDLANREKGWVELPSWPGEPRGYAVSVAQSDGFDNCFYLFSGRNYRPDGSVKVLTDGYVYNPRLNSWKKLKGKFPVMAGTALATGANHILFLGGVPELIAGSDTHPGFDPAVRLYHTITHTLTEKEKAPYPLAVTTTLARKNHTFYIASGEIKPGIRTSLLVKGEIIPFEKNLGTANALVIVLYFILLAGIGFYFSKKQKNTDDYFKGGGRLPWWAVGLSIFGTSLSAITFMSIPAKSYSSDWGYLLVNAGILMVVPFILYLFVPFYRKLNVTTAYEYLELRFNPAIRVICSVAFILFQIGRMGIVLYLPAIALHVVTGFDILFCIGLMGILSLLYTMMGGIEAVVWTDALQVVVLLGGALLVVFMAALHVPGGFTGIVREAAADHKFDLGTSGFDLRQSTLWTVLIATFFTNLTTYGTDQTMVQRYMTTETGKEAQKSILTNAVLTIPATLLFFFVGTVLYVYYKHTPTDLSLTISDGDAILPWYIYSQLPAGVTGLLISGIFAAAMSTLSSSMNSAATAYMVDIQSKITGYASSKSLRNAQLATLGLGIAGIVFAYVMATWDIQSLWDEFNRIVGIILGSLGGLFLLGMVTRKANSTGALCGIIGSIAVQYLMIRGQYVHLLLYTTTGFISCFAIGYGMSLLIPGNRENKDHLTIYNIFLNHQSHEKL